MRHIWEKVMSMQHSFEEFSEKQRRDELTFVGNFVAKTVLVESANQFSLEKLCRTQYTLKYFWRPIDHQTYCKNLISDLKWYIHLSRSLFSYLMDVPVYFWYTIILVIAQNYSALCPKGFHKQSTKVDLDPRPKPPLTVNLCMRFQSC